MRYAEDHGLRSILDINLKLDNLHNADMPKNICTINIVEEYIPRIIVRTQIA